MTLLQRTFGGGLCGEGHVVVYVIEGCCDRYCCGEGSCS